jgi:very-short-patch-repair endonuclease
LKKKQSAKTKSQRRRTLLKKYGVTRSWLLSKSASKPQKELTKFLKQVFPQYTILSDFAVDRYKLDILFKELNLVIEFNGTYWHCDPRFYEKYFFNKKKKLKAEEIWSYDDSRKTFLESLGYKVIVVWEHDYKENQEQTLSLLREQING